MIYYFHYFLFVLYFCLILNLFLIIILNLFSKIKYFLAYFFLKKQKKKFF